MYETRKSAPALTGVNLCATCILFHETVNFCMAHLFIAALYEVYDKGVGDRGGTAVKALCYKSEGRRWCHWNFSLT